MGNIMNIYRTLYAPLKKVQDFSQFYKLNHKSLKREAIAPFPRAYERLLQSSESQISFHKSNEFFSKIKNYREKKKKSLTKNNTYFSLWPGVSENPSTQGLLLS